MEVSSSRRTSVGRATSNGWGSAAATYTNVSPSKVSTEDEAEALLNSFLKPKTIAPLPQEKTDDVLQLAAPSTAENCDTTKPTSFQRLTLPDNPETFGSKNLRNQKCAASFTNPSSTSSTKHSSKAQRIRSSSSGGTRLSPVISQTSETESLIQQGGEKHMRRSLDLESDERSTRVSKRPSEGHQRKRDANGNIKRSTEVVQPSIGEGGVEEPVHIEQIQETSLPGIPPLSQRRDALRTRLLQTGLWYEEVDRLIHHCEDDLVQDDDVYHESGLILMPAESRPLTLPRALKLLNDLNVFADQEDEIEGDSVNEKVANDSSPKAPSPRGSLETEQAVTPSNGKRSLPYTDSSLGSADSQPRKAHATTEASSQSLLQEDNPDNLLNPGSRSKPPTAAISSASDKKAEMGRHTMKDKEAQHTPPLKATATNFKNRPQALNEVHRHLNATRRGTTSEGKEIYHDLQDRTDEPAGGPRLSALGQRPAIHSASKDNTPNSDTSLALSLQTLRDVVSSGKATPKQMKAFNDHLDRTLSRSNRAETSTRQRSHSRSLEIEASKVSKMPTSRKGPILNVQDEAIAIVSKAAVADEKALKALRRVVASGEATSIERAAYQRYLDLNYAQSSGEVKNPLGSKVSYSAPTVRKEHENTSPVPTTKPRNVWDSSKSLFIGKSGPKSGKPARLDWTTKAATRSVIHKMPATPSKTSKASLLNSIRTGALSRQGGHKSAFACLKSRSDDHLRAWKSFKGASHDVIHTAWSNDGTKYAIGTAALVDSHTMQYNRPNNLLLGNVITNTLSEIPGHHTARPNRAVAERSGLDPRLFQTITAVRWSQGTENGNRLYTTSYDHTVKIWDAADTSNVTCLSTAWHKDRVTDLALSTPTLGLFATGTENANGGLRIFRYDEANQQLSATSLELGAESRPHQHTTCCLQYGQTSATQEYLAAGFARMDTEDDGSITTEGILSVWRQTPTSAHLLKIKPCSQNVFDIAWHPSARYFATANAAPLSARKKDRIRSMVRVYDPEQVSRLIEYDCPAADLNIVTFCPTDSDYITASATNGKTYVWDYRRPDQILHEFAHGVPIPELPHDRPRESVDVGVRVALWGRDSSRFYTGGSDGVLKEWDIRKATEDALTRDVIRVDAEIMSGAFSPDGSNLVLGDAAGGVHLLSKAPIDDSELELVAATMPEGDTAEDPWTEGRRAAAELVTSGQIEIVPGWGAGKGEKYLGPWASWAGPEDRNERIVIRQQTKRKRSVIAAAATPSLAPIITISDDDELEAMAAARRREKRRRKKEKKLKKELKRQAVSGNVHSAKASSKKSSAIVDLTQSDDEEDETQAGASMDDDLFEDDAWFPPHWMVDANIQAEEV